MSTLSHALSGAALALAALLPATPAAAQSLGLAHGEVMVSAPVSGTGPKALRLSGSYRITENHIAQLDLTARQAPGGWSGEVTGHLALAPNASRKYGVYASLMDLSGRSGTVGTAGIEGMIDLGPRAWLEGRLGAGIARPGQTDFVTAGLRGGVALSSSTSLSAGLTATNIAESAFSATVWQADVTLRARLGDSGATLDLAFEHDRLTGRNAAPGETQVRLGLGWAFGGNGRAVERPFRVTQPFDALVRRGLF